MYTTLDSPYCLYCQNGRGSSQLEHFVLIRLFCLNYFFFKILENLDSLKLDLD